MALVLAALALVAGSAAATKSAVQRGGYTIQTFGGIPAGAEYMPGEVLVGFKRGSSAVRQAATLRSHGARVAEALRIPGVKLVRLPRGQSVKAAVAAFESDPSVRYAEPNYIYKASATIPNDTRFAELWGLNQASDKDIDAPEAWDVTTGSPNVVVAVVDTGVAWNHPDLDANIWVNNDPIGGGDNDGNGKIDDLRGWDFVNNDNDPRDFNLHGTHVAGTIAAEGNNALGVVGVGWQTKIMPVRVLDAGGSGTLANVASGFDYAGDEGADIVNASLGGGSTTSTMQTAITDHPNTLFVFAAGNGGFDGIGDNNDVTPTYPCNVTGATVGAFGPNSAVNDNVICVAATDQNDALTSFSNYGATTVDLAAPGKDTLSTFPSWSGVFFDGFEADNLLDVWYRVAVVPMKAWNRTTEAENTGSFSLADSPGENYVENTNSLISMNDPMVLTGRQGCRVRVALRLASENGFDWLWFETATSVFGPHTPRVRTSGNSGGVFLQMAPFDISAFDGAAALFLGARFTSDNTINGDGVWIDDLNVECLSAAGSYNSISGTSMATPHVAGSAALVLAANPGLSTAQLRDAILNNTDAVASLAGKVRTGGRLNVNKAVNAVAATPPTATFTAPAKITDPVRANFSEKVRGVTTGNFVLRVQGTATNLPASVLCKNGSGTLVLCTATSIRSAELKPASALIPGQRYTMIVNPVGAPTAIKDAANVDAVTTKTQNFRASLSEQESSKAAKYTWQTVANASAHGGSYTRHDLAGATATYPFTGTSIQLHTVRGPNMGKAEVLIDGASKGIIDLYAATTTFGAMFDYGGLAAGAHTFKLEVEGTKNASSTGTFVALDALQVGASHVTTPAAKYAWQIQAAPAASGGKLARSELGQTRVDFKFRGTSVALITNTNANSGKFEAFIDGVSKGVFDNYSAAAAFGVARNFGGLTNAVHTLRIVALGTKNAASANTLVGVDRFTVG